MITKIKKIAFLLSKRERRQALIVIAFMTFTSFLEVIGVASVVPFLSVLGDQSTIEKNQYLYNAYSFFGFTEHSTFLIFLGCASIGIIIISALVRSFGNYITNRFVNMRRHTICEKLIQKYVHHDYSFFLMNNSNSLAKTILSETDQVVAHALGPFFRLVTFSLVTLMILGLLLLVNTKVTLVLFALLVGFYVIFYGLVKRYLDALGKDRIKANDERFKVVSEIFGGMKELKVLRREETYQSLFKGPSIRYSKHQATHQTLALVPKHLIEALGFSSILLVALYFLNADNAGLGKILPTLGLFALAGHRLLPALQSIYAAISSLKFSNAALDCIIDDLKRNEYNELQSTKNSNIARLTLRNEIKLKNICFQYNNSETLALSNIELAIPARSMIGIIGATGSGKTTLIDLILGLLRPTSGEMWVDDKKLTPHSIVSWQKNVGYVPQNIFLADDMIKNNIAFGISNNKVDLDRVKEVAKMAQIHNFIVSLPNGYDTYVGERGARLSGGQKQRLGIARALYHNPQVLILDESTSALDNETEAEVMKAVNSMAGNKTIIMIAHRLSTVKRCNTIVTLEKGKLKIVKNNSLDEIKEVGS